LKFRLDRVAIPVARASDADEGKYPPGYFTGKQSEARLDAALDRCGKIDWGTPEGLIQYQSYANRVMLRSLADAAAEDEADQARCTAWSKKRVGRRPADCWD
jgi:hypothetical protein